MSSFCWWELLVVSSEWQLRYNPVPWPLMSSFLHVRQKIKAYCSTHTSQAMPALASKWCPLHTSFLLKPDHQFNGCQFSIYLLWEGHACWGAIATNRCLTPQLFWLLLSTRGHSAFAVVNPEGWAGPGTVRIFLQVTLASPFNSVSAVDSRLFLEAILTTRLSPLQYAVALVKRDVRIQSLPHHFPAPADSTCACWHGGARKARERGLQPAGPPGAESWRKKGPQARGAAGSPGQGGSPRGGAWESSRERVNRAPGNSSWGLGNGSRHTAQASERELAWPLRPGRRRQRSGGGRRQVLKLNRDRKESEAEAGSGGVAEEKTSGSQPGQRPGKGPTIQQGSEAPRARARQLLRAGRGTGSQKSARTWGNSWSGMDDSKVENRGCRGWGTAQLLKDEGGGFKSQSHSQWEGSQWPPPMEEKKNWGRKDWEYSHFKGKILYIKQLNCSILLSTIQTAHSCEYAWCQSPETGNVGCGCWRPGFHSGCSIQPSWLLPRWKGSPILPRRLCKAQQLQSVVIWCRTGQMTCGHDTCTLQGRHGAVTPPEHHSLW